MSSASFRKIRFFGPGRRLAAPEGPKIAGGTLSRSRAPARSSFYAFPFCAIEASFWMICISVRLQGPPRCEGFLLLVSGAGKTKTFFLAP